MSDKKIPEEILAAISMAIYEIQEQVHDIESNILTIKRPAQEYLPWGDKSLVMQQMPSRK